MQWFWKIIAIVTPSHLNDFGEGLQSFSEVIAIIFLTVAFLRWKHCFWSWVYLKKQVFFIRNTKFCVQIQNIILFWFLGGNYTLCKAFIRWFWWLFLLCKHSQCFAFNMYFLNSVRVPSNWFSFDMYRKNRFSWSLDDIMTYGGNCRLCCKLLPNAIKFSFERNWI